MKTLIDISPSLRVGMGVFPGDAVFAVSQTFTIGPDCPVNVASIAMSTHCGAHVDALVDAVVQHLVEGACDHVVRTRTPGP